MDDSPEDKGVDVANFVQNQNSLAIVLTLFWSAAATHAVPIPSLNPVPILPLHPVPLLTTGRDSHTFAHSPTQSSDAHCPC